MELYTKYGYAPEKEAIAHHLELIASVWTRSFRTRS